MDADVKRFVGLLAPLAIAYMTYSAVTAEVFGVSRADIRPISSSPPPAMPKLPSTERELRDPFVPEGSVAQILAAAASGKAEKEEELRLEGTVVAGSLRFAIINGTRVMEGDFFRGMKLAKVETSQVRLVGGKQETIVPLGIAKSETIKPMESPATDPRTSRSSAPARAKAAAPAASTGSKGATGSTGSTGSKGPGGARR